MVLSESRDIASSFTNLQTEGNVEQRTIITIRSNINITSCLKWLSFLWIRLKNKTVQCSLTSNTFVRIDLRIRTRTSGTKRFKDLKLGTVFEHHVYEIHKIFVTDTKWFRKFNTKSKQTNKKEKSKYLGASCENDRKILV